MIKKLKIKNFECWKDAEFVFSPGVNIICGESDQGKSSIIRAIQYNCLNRPSGTSFRSDFLENNKEVTSVEITFKEKDNKHNIITRERNLTSINNYIINKEETFTALRTDVPDEVQNISKMQEINIQGQHPDEQYFLLTKKPGQVAKELNKVSGLEIMDKALANINSQVRETNTELKLFNKELKDIEDFLSETKWIKDAEIQKEEIILKQEEITSFEIRIKNISSVLVNIQKIGFLIDSYEDVPLAIQALSAIAKKRKALNESKEKFQELQQKVDYINKVDKITKRLIQVPISLNQLNVIVEKKTEIVQEEKKKETVHNVLKRLATLDLIVNRYADIENSINAVQTLIKQAESIKKTSSRKKDLLDKLTQVQTMENLVSKASKEFKQVEKDFLFRIKTEKCPVCGREG